MQYHLIDPYDYNPEFAKMAEINRYMSAQLRARKEAAESGQELP